MAVPSWGRMWRARLLFQHRFDSQLLVTERLYGVETSCLAGGEIAEKYSNCTRKAKSGDNDPRIPYKRHAENVDSDCCYCETHRYSKRAAKQRQNARLDQKLK